jgi:hypothetical protein
MRRSRLRRLLGCASSGLLASAAIMAAAPAAQAATTPRTVAIQVVPTLGGVQFTLGGIPGVTDPSGRATLPDSNLAGAAQTVALMPKQQRLTPDLRVSLDKVANDVNHGAFSRKLIVELDEERAVTINLLTPRGTILQLDHVTSVALNNSLGQTITLSQSQLKSPVWLPASRPHRVSNGVSGRQVSYSVKSVMIRGTNVVNSGQWRSTTDRSLVWRIPIITHSLTIDANDLLAGKPAGRSVQLTYPNGTKETVLFAANHRVTVTNLPRGTYRVKVNGGLIPLASTVHLSRDQTATELVITTGDFAEITAIVLAVLAIIVAAGIIGRRRRRDAGPVEHDAGRDEAAHDRGVADAVLA